jgi:hypothetical protein
LGKKIINPLGFPEIDIIVKNIKVVITVINEEKKIVILGIIIDRTIDFDKLVQSYLFKLILLN